MRVVVTGARGFIGSHLVPALVAAGHDVLANDVRPATDGARPLQTADASSPAFVEEVAGEQPDAIVNLAALMGTTASMRRPADFAAANIVTTLRTWEAAARSGARLVVMSTGAVYGDTPPVPVDETHPHDPMCAYSLSKSAADQFVALLDRHAGRGHVTLRPGSVYGPPAGDEVGFSLPALFAASMLRGERCAITGTGDQRRDYVYVGDVVRAIQASIDLPYAVEPVCVHVATGVSTSVREIHSLLASIIGVPNDPAFVDARGFEPANTALDPTAARDRLGWQAEVPLAVGLTALVDGLKRVGPTAEPRAAPAAAS